MTRRDVIAQAIFDHFEAGLCDVDRVRGVVKGAHGGRLFAFPLAEAIDKALADKIEVTQIQDPDPVFIYGSSEVRGWYTIRDGKAVKVPQ